MSRAYHSNEFFLDAATLRSLPQRDLVFPPLVRTSTQELGDLGWCGSFAQKVWGYRYGKAKFRLYSPKDPKQSFTVKILDSQHFVIDEVSKLWKYLEEQPIMGSIPSDYRAYSPEALDGIYQERIDDISKRRDKAIIQASTLEQKLADNQELVQRLQDAIVSMTSELKAMEKYIEAGVPIDDVTALRRMNEASLARLGEAAYAESQPKLDPRFEMIGGDVEERMGKVLKLIVPPKPLFLPPIEEDRRDAQAYR